MDVTGVLAEPELLVEVAALPGVRDFCDTLPSLFFLLRINHLWRATLMSTKRTPTNREAINTTATVPMAMLPLASWGCTAILTDTLPARSNTQSDTALELVRTSMQRISQHISKGKCHKLHNAYSQRGSAYNKGTCAQNTSSGPMFCQRAIQLF